MPNCELLETCAFFNDKMDDIPSIANVYKTKYCKGNNETCARFIVYKALGRCNVPGNLYPNNIDKAEKLINKVKL